MRRVLAISLLCLVAFWGGWLFHVIFPYGDLPIRARAIKRAQLKRILDLREIGVLEVVAAKDEEMKGFTKRHLQLRWKGLPFEAYLLVPHGAKGRMPAIIAIPGHHTTKREVSGERPSRFGADYGRRLVEDGFCVLIPDVPFAEDIRREDLIALNLIMTGSHLTGLRLCYLSTLLDYLSSLPFVDANRIGCVGWSMGGGLAMYLAAVYRRIKVLAISSYLGSYRETFMRMRQTTDNYIPGVLKFGEMPDVACLIAPRPLWLEHPQSDLEFPLRAFLQGIDRLKVCYKGYEERLNWQFIPGGHRFVGEGVREWFKKWL